MIEHIYFDHQNTISYVTALRSLREDEERRIEEEERGGEEESRDEKRRCLDSTYSSIR